MAASKSAKRRNRSESQWRRQRNQIREINRQKRDAEMYRRGEAPLCMERVPGLYWIDGQEGYYAKSRGMTGFLAFDAKTRRIVSLDPVSPEEAGESILRHAEEQAMWLERYDEVPF